MLEIQMIALQEHREAHQRVNRGQWIVGDQSSYMIESGLLRPVKNGTTVGTHAFWTPSGARRYYPITHPELPEQFARLANGDEKEILRFVRTYGHLGYESATASTLSIYRVLRDLGDHVSKEKLDSYFHPGIREGDPVEWIVVHASNVDLVLKLKHLESRRRELEEYLDTRLDRRRNTYIFNYATRSWLEGRPLSMKADLNPKEVVSEVISVVLTENLEGTHRVVYESGLRARSRDTGRSSLETAFEGKCLLDYIYWHLADAVTRGQIGRCVACGRLFVVRHQNQKYCARRSDQKGESLCALAYRQRRWRPKARTQRKREHTAKKR
jgi:hypothetical protein